jgi:hypothetical protein
MKFVSRIITMQKMQRLADSADRLGCGQCRLKPFFQVRIGLLGRKTCLGSYAIDSSH